MYSIGKISEITGISSVTLRAWERRYNLVSPQRDKNGTRLYSEDDLQRLLWAKNQIRLQGLTISQIVERLKNNDRTDSKPILSSKKEDLSRQLYDSLKQYDTNNTHLLIDQCFSQFDIEYVAHEVFSPILIKVGEEWRQGDLSIGQEHFMTQIITQRLQQLFHAMPADPTKKKVMALCPPGEQHMIGLMLFTLFLKRRGHEVVFLGADMPLTPIAHIVEHNNINIVAWSISKSKDVQSVLAKSRTLLDCYPDLQIVYGGRGFSNTYSDSVTCFAGSTLEEWETWRQKL